MNRKRLFEFFLLLLIIYTIVFLWNEHVGYLLTLIMAAVVFAILLISYLVEYIEPSKVPATYFYVMWILFLAPAVVMIFFSLLAVL